MTAQTRSLGEHMSERRNRIGISQSRAAKLAGVSRTSWVAWEKNTATPEDYNHIKIETALQWVPGSVRAIQAGREPTLIEAPDLDDRDKMALRLYFDELSEEHGPKKARRLIDEVLAERAESTPDRPARIEERGTG